MSTLIQFVLLSTVLVFGIAFPHKPENILKSQNKLTTSQKMLLAKDSTSQSQRCTSSPTPGCSRRDNVTELLTVDS